MKIELHLHTNRYSACAVHSPREMTRALIEAAYEAVFITEHDAVWTDMELDELQSEFHEIKIFPGVEISIGPNFAQHLLVLGTNDRTYLRLPHAEDIVRRARGEGHLTILAHPFRWEGGAELLNGEALPDAMEAHTNNHSPECAARALAESANLDMAAVNTGDTHSREKVNRFWIETARPLKKPDDIRKIILANAYENCAEAG